MKIKKQQESPKNDSDVIDVDWVSFSEKYWVHPETR